MNTAKKILAIVLCICMAAGLAACGGKKEAAKDPNAPKPVILVVSFGTSYNDNRDLSIGGIENALAEAYGDDYEVRRAFTSQIIIDKLKDRDGIEIDNVEEAMERLIADGVKEVVVQPTHIMAGYEYDDVVEEVNEYKDQFDKLVIGKNLLASDTDFDLVATVLIEESKQYLGEGKAVAFMGHGTEHESNATYEKLQAKFKELGHDDIIVGTVEAEPSVDDVIHALSAGDYDKVTLMPLMVVAGDHANNDMAGDEEDSWKSQIEAEGFEVDCVLQGLGQLSGIQAVYVLHVLDAVVSDAFSK